MKVDVGISKSKKHRNKIGMLRSDTWGCYDTVVLGNFIPPLICPPGQYSLVNNDPQDIIL